jgi:hypothetical protein
VVDSDLDTDTGVDQTDEGRGDTDEVGASAVRRASVASDIGHETTANDKSGLGTDNPELVHGVDNLEHGLRVRDESSGRGEGTHVHGLVELTAVNNLPGDGDVVVLEVGLDLVLVDGMND